MPKQKNQRKPRLMEHISDESDDEEIDEDEAFNSEDERRFGSFFEDSKHASDSEEVSSDEVSDDNEGLASEDDDSHEGDGGQYMLDLLDKLDSTQDKNNEGGESKSSKIATHVKESKFSSAVVGKADLTLDSLMEGIKDTKGFGVVQKTMKKVAQGQTTSAPAARVVSDRAQRKVHYEDQSKEVSQWIDAVQQNRQAETLDFRPKERMEVTRDVLVEKFVPTTDFEKQIAAALEEAGQQDEEAILKAEEAALQDDLGENEISMEEYKKRRGQLAKMRALMFYHEQKRHHINKIKSKKYRRIRKKQRERQKEAEIEAQVEDNPDLARELEEKEELERMKERMTLAHRNTSKWAKRILRRGKNVDVDTRRALSAQIQRGDDLLQRMQSTRRGEGDEDDSDEDLIETARKVLADTETETNDDAIQGKGLFKLSFMQRGIERQRERAKEEARQLLSELEADEMEDDEEQNVSDEKEKTQRNKKAKVASKDEMKQVLNDGEMVASSLKFGNSNSLAVSGGINIDMELPEPETKGKREKSAGTFSEHDTTLSVAVEDGSSAAPEKKSERKFEPKPSSSKKRKATEPAITAEDESNPWLLPDESEAADSVGAVPNEKKKARPSARNTGIVDVEWAVDLLETNEQTTPKSAPAGESSAEDGKDQKKITMLTQEELVRKAFAAPSEKEVEEEFAKEKEAMEEQEDPTRKKKKEKALGTVSGWGSWVGMGAPPPKPPRKLPKHLQAPEKKLPKRKRQDAKKPTVILSEKRIKKTADQFMVAQIPYPFTSREEYERAMVGGMGREWNVTSAVKDMTRPEILTRPGKMIQPLSKRVKQKRPAAKF